MIPLPWPRKSVPSAGKARVARIERELCADTKCAAEANIAELRARRSQLTLNAILDDVIAASLTAAQNGGRENGGK